MAGRGMAGSGQRQRSRDESAVKAQYIDVVPDGELRGFDLPEGVLPDNEPWHVMTVQWWNTWRESPQAQQMLATDWQELLATALLHHIMWSKGRWEFASEVRLRAAKFGATPEDRQRLKMNVKLPADGDGSSHGTSSAVTNIASRRARLMG